MRNELILEVRGLCKTFYLHEQDKAVYSARDAALTATAGEATVLVGPSGAGKSSVLKCIYRTYVPTQGAILYRCADGRVVDLARADEAEIIDLRRREIGFVTQFLHCLPRQSTLDVVARPMLARGMNAQEALTRSRAVLALLGIPESLWDVAPATFSGGERQRVNIARALAAPMRLLLLDEPTASLDPESRERVLQLVEQRLDEGAAVIAVLHTPADIERLSNQTIRIAPAARAEPELA